MGQHSRLRSWWQDNPANPDHPTLNNPDVKRLLMSRYPTSSAIDLGGTMSLNIHVVPENIVLRVHQPFVSRERLLAIQRVRQALTAQGLQVPLPEPNATVLRCGKRWAEIEVYRPHQRLPHTFEAYCWLFQALGRLHHALSTCDNTVPRPLVATYAPPSSLRRWLTVTQQALHDHPQAFEIAHYLGKLVRELRRQWHPASHLPQQLIHGDIHLSNVCQTPDKQTIYLDFGFLAYRPRIHDLTYALAFMLLALNGPQKPQDFAWHRIALLLNAYETTAHTRLSEQERKALTPYTAAIPLYAAALDGFSYNPARQLQGRLPFLHLSEWLLTCPQLLQQ
ncbi:Ser/Thr protein kinase RdoA (MazF antagonist) [Thermosporothrix hazakensis]|jgi:Ser/Thr protein kinase RdoA (MazF antagonist)|uniref:Ser/Thr protein kinase RdoA (MazF antagonist) n=1 Tax=Thermosporothrix hazakensis TaxID=644383 RepID=A0A326UC19_THEHA|nr:phosphotransferase [Thermosporothrix hazakensis]PZW31232.1 Ser/Thr protein kinase RdoA (MazF antagonist) [Thermosporothrix hazakensis]GCE50860.1 hypothetical protein KTH_57290 [Thermosporothrix hazakensis]